jgi:hypothetical protein
LAAERRQAVVPVAELRVVLVAELLAVLVLRGDLVLQAARVPHRVRGFRMFR